MYVRMCVVEKLILVNHPQCGVMMCMCGGANRLLRYVDRAIMVQHNIYRYIDYIGHTYQLHTLISMQKMFGEPPSELVVANKSSVIVVVVYVLYEHIIDR